MVHLKAGAVIVVGLALSACEATERETLALGERVYASHCASCHGAKLEGQPDWKQKLPNGRFPAPPHDATGHTWAHSDKWLFRVVENGMVPPLVRKDYESDMPAFGDKLSGAEIRAVLAYIKAQWPDGIHRKREEMLTARREESLNAGKVLQRAR